MYKVFIKDKPLLLLDSFEATQLSGGSFIMHYHDVAEIPGVLKLLEEFDNVQRVILFSENIQELWSDFQSHFRLISAAGGLVFHNRSLLFIYRNGKWDLPKGKLEEGETPAVCAVREVEEECGVKGEIVGKEIEATYHVYELNGEKILKKTHWFQMETDNHTDLKPQEEEGITKVTWKSTRRLNAVYNNTYHSIAELLHQTLDRRNN